MASIFKRGETWWLKYRVDGKTVRESLETKNERVARDRQRDVEAMGRLGQLRAPSATPFRPFLSRFCVHLKGICTPDGYKTDLSRLRGLFGPCVPELELGSHVPRKFRRQADDVAAVTVAGTRLPIVRLEDLTPLSISNHLSERVADGEITGKTANKYREILQRMFNYAIAQHGYRSPDRDRKHPVEAVRRFPESWGEITWLTHADIDEQLRALEPDRMLHAMVATYIYAGLRRAEALWLTPRDVDLGRQLIHVRSKTVAGESWVPKTKKNRVVPMGRSLSAILTAFAKRQSPGRGWFFHSPQGQRWHPDNFSQALAEANGKAGLSWSCLDFRHTFGSHLAQGDMSLFKISTLMGNSPAICARHYAALVPESMHDEVEFAGPTAGDGNKSVSEAVRAGSREDGPVAASENVPYLRLVR